jgi:hypothetical protein
MAELRARNRQKRTRKTRPNHSEGTRVKWIRKPDKPQSRLSGMALEKLGIWLKQAPYRCQRRLQGAGRPPCLVLDFLVQGMTTKIRIVLHLLDFTLLLLFVALRHVTGRTFALLARFSAFQNYVFPGHSFLWKGAKLPLPVHACK